MQNQNQSNKPNLSFFFFDIPILDSGLQVLQPSRVVAQNNLMKQNNVSSARPNEKKWKKMGGEAKGMPERKREHNWQVKITIIIIIKKIIFTPTSNSENMTLICSCVIRAFFFCTISTNGTLKTWKKETKKIKIKQINKKKQKKMRSQTGSPTHKKTVGYSSDTTCDTWCL